MKFKKKEKNYAVFYFAGLINFFCTHEVFTWDFFKKRPTIHYLKKRRGGDAR